LWAPPSCATSAAVSNLLPRRHSDGSSIGAPLNLGEPAPWQQVGVEDCSVAGCGGWVRTHHASAWAIAVAPRNQGWRLVRTQAPRGVDERWRRARMWQGASAKGRATLQRAPSLAMSTHGQQIMESTRGQTAIWPCTARDVSGFIFVSRKHFFSYAYFPPSPVSCGRFIIIKFSLPHSGRRTYPPAPRAAPPPSTPRTTRARTPHCPSPQPT